MSEEGVDHAPCQEEVARLTATLAQVTRERDEARSEAEKERKSKDFHICYGEQIIHKLESRLATLEGAVRDTLDTLHLHAIPELQGAYRLVNDGEVEQLERRLSALLPPPQERG